MTVTNLPAALVPLVQNGTLDRTLLDALMPENLWRQLATPDPMEAGLGDTLTKTRTGLMVPNDTPIAPGADPAAGAYGLEQFSVTMSRYGDGSLLTTDMIGQVPMIQSRWLLNQQKIAIHAGQSLNQFARNRLYRAYKGGNTYAVGAGTTITALVVADVTGFTQVLINGVPTAVSGANPLPISINGGSVVNVTAVNAGTNTLTLASAQTWTDGQSVVSTLAPRVIRAGARATEKAITSSDVASLGIFLDAVAELRSRYVPTINGAYVAKIDAKTERQLFADSDFKQAYQGRGDSPVWGDLSLGRFGGIDWVRDETTPMVTIGAVTVHQPIVVGADALIEAPLANLAQVFQTDAQKLGGVVTFQEGVAFINVAPTDAHLSQVKSSWMWIGDIAVPSDATNAVTAAQFKRAIVVQHYAA